MFDILEADIVVLQETKIQRKDLHDDMVLVPGWDVYFSLPKFKKGSQLSLMILTKRLLTDSPKAIRGLPSTPVTPFVPQFELKKASRASSVLKAPL